ncbi:chromate transporter [uncultured Ilyobacter sp.]|uniref:chromate transporter n=1 Tax=uncultured Ilyobacter sp. TaxID=544433 RepID=UPI0029C8FE06|nr:chromate transporter [uncultured Ilyobacter sp.]
MILWEIFWSFFKIGAVTFGGGYAMIPLIEKEMITNKKWIDEEELLEIIAIAQMTPGVIAINTATFVGRKAGGIKGALIASVAVVLPSLFVISVIVTFLSGSFDTILVQKFLTGVRGGLLALMAHSLLRLFRSGANNIVGIALLAVTLITLIFSILSPINLIIFGSVTGIMLYRFFPRFTLKYLGGDKK